MQESEKENKTAVKTADAPGCSGGCACREEKNERPRAGFWVAEQGPHRHRSIVEVTRSGDEYLVRPWGASNQRHRLRGLHDGDDDHDWTLVEWIEVEGATGAFKSVIEERDRLIAAIGAARSDLKALREERDSIAGERDAARAERDRLRGRIEDLQREGEAKTETAIEAGQEGIRYWRDVATSARDAWWRKIEQAAPPDPADDGIPF